MELPSIKLNIYKKVEYFLVLNEFDLQFSTQMEVMNNEAESPTNIKNYPTWEIEKKVLFWSYIYHKFLEHPIRPGHLTLDAMFITTEERNNAHPSVIFENLSARGFGKHKVESTKKRGKEHVFYFNEKGLDFGNLIWYLFTVEDCKKSKQGISYGKNYGANFILRRSKLGKSILYAQLYAIIFFTLFGSSWLVLEILSITHLLDNFISSIKILAYYPNIFITVAWLPVILLVYGSLVGAFYKWFFVNRRYKVIEELKKSLT